LVNVNLTLVKLRELTEDVGKNVAPIAEDVRTITVTISAALDRVEKTLVALQGMIDPDAPLTYDLQRTLERLGATADSIRNFVDYLDRNPDALIRGRQGSP